MSIHSVSMKGKRPANEDRHEIAINLDGKDSTKAPINYYGVFDGHGGKFVSKFLNDHMSQSLTDVRVSYPLKKMFVKKIYDFWQNELKTKHYNYAVNTGSTCLIVIQYKSENCDYLNVLNTGDSRAVICRNNIATALSKDHKPNWPEESVRIKSLGGDIVFDGFDWRIQDLSVSRAFGDISSSPYVSHLPDIFRYKLTCDDKFIILACDGLWDVLSNQDVINFILDNCFDLATGVRINKHVNIAKKLAEFAMIKGTSDNVTIVIVFFS